MSHVDSEIRFDELDPVTLIIGVKHGNTKSSNGAGKCLTGDTIIIDTKGQEHYIKDIVDHQQKLEIFSIDEKGRICKGNVVGWYNNGRKTVYEITTGTGRRVRCTDNHPFLTYSAVKSLKSLKVGDTIAVPRIMPTESDGSISQNEAILLGYMLAEGGRREGKNGNSGTFTNSEQCIVDECNRCLNAKGAELILYSNGNPISYNIRNISHLRGKHKTPFKQWCREIGLVNKTSLNKAIPQVLMRSSEDTIALFLGRYLSGDGTVCLSKIDKSQYDKQDRWEIGYTSSSERMIRQIQHLLLRLGLMFRLSVRSSQYNGMKLGHNTYYLSISSKKELTKFYSSIGPYVVGKKARQLQLMIRDLQGKKSNTNVDILPWEARFDIHEAIKVAGSSWHHLNKQKIWGPYYGTNCYSREKVQQIAEITGSTFLCKISQGDILWDTVSNITRVDEEDVYDIEIDSDSHFFVANDIFVHNSVLFDAITWALYEKSRASGSTSTSIDSVVRNGTDKAEVEFHFCLGEDLYRVVRSRDQKRRKSDVTFQVKNGSRWRSVGADDKKGTTKKIVHTVGLEYNVFVNSVLLEQHEALAFAKMTSSERKDVVTKILQLDHYDDYRAQAKKKLEELDKISLKSDLYIRDHGDAEKIQLETRKDLEGIQDQIRIHQKRLKTLRSILENLRKQQAKENKKITALQDLLFQRDKIKAHIFQSTAGLKDVGAKIRKYETEIVVLKDAITEKKESLFKIKQERGNPSLIKRDFKEWSIKVEDLTEKKTDVTVKVQTYSSQLKVLQEERQRIEDMEEGGCPTCYQDISAESKQGALDVLLKKIEDYQKQFDKYRQLCKKITSALEEATRKLMEAQAQKDTFNKLQEKGRSLMTALESDQKSLVTLTEAYTDAKSYKKEYTDALAMSQDELADCLNKIEDLGDMDEDRFNALTKEIVEKNAEVESVTNVINGLQQKVGGLQERIETQQTILDKIKEIRHQQEILNKERRVEKELVNAFGKTGIQALILENSAVEIEKIANQLLSNLTDGNVNIQIQTQKLNQDGTFREVFDIIITDEHHSSSFNMFSGGEKFRIAFVIRMALSILLSRRSGVKVSAIFYDEAFQDLDESGIDKMMEIFGLLSQDFRHQLVITHTSQMKDYFDDIITVEKTSEGSFVSR
jgi:DNA repair exonuclease SbcCD ATPase subunit/intein/homing endonuclease